MKKSKKILLISLSVIIALLVSVAVAGAFTLSSESTELMKYIVGLSDERPEYADVTNDGAVNVLDVIALVKQQNASSVRLETLTLDDDNYTFVFDKDHFAYTVRLPEGRPTIPRVNATAADGVDIEIFQAYIPDGESSGTAKIIATDSEGTSNTYTVNFIRDNECGFVLQYDDRYEFKTPETAGVTFESTNSEVVSVDENGIMHAKKVSSESVTITAKANGQTVDTLVIDRVEKAHVNLFLVTGQSNAQGCYANSTANDSALNAAQLALVESIGGDGRVYSYDHHPRPTNTGVIELRYTLYDMNTVNKQGFQSSLGKTWYNLSGEKIVFLQTAYSGAPIQSWLDPDRHEEAGTYTKNKYNFYNDTQESYAKLIPLLEDNYEIIRTANFWNQGGTAMTSLYVPDAGSGYGDYLDPGDAGYDESKLLTDAEYYRMFMLIHEDMKEDFGIELCGIFLNRVIPTATSAENKTLQSHTDMVPIRSAQYALHNFVEEISLVSRVGDYAKRTTWKDTTDPGWGFVDSDNVHFTQIGHNERGRAAARNAFSIWFGKEAAQSVEIVAENGRDRLTPDNTITIDLGDEYRIAGYALPESSGEKTFLTSSDTNVVKVNDFGVVRGIAEGTATITATTESGKTQSFNVKIVRPEVVKVIAEATTYRWDFNDLTATGTKNDLTVSSCTKYYGADKNYTLTGGIYSVGDSAADSAGYVNRPDFELEKPITLSSRESWTIEWRGSMKQNGILMGPKQTDPLNTDTTSYPFLYVFHTTKYSNYGYPLKVNLYSSDSKNIFLDFGEYRTLVKTMNSWRLGYDVTTKTMSLYYLNPETKAWDTVDSQTVGEFDMTFYSLFGRARGNGYIGYYGDMDYIQVDFMQEYEITADTNYLWEFNDLTSSMDKNDLTLSKCAEELGADKNYKLENGVFYALAGATSSTQKKNPDFEMEHPVTFTNEKSWILEWCGMYTKGGSVLLGPSQTDVTATSSTYPFIYLFPYTQYSSSTGYPIKFALSSKDATNIFLNYGSYRNLNKSMSSWRIAYNAETSVLSLYYLNTESDNWEVVDSKTVGEFSMTFTSIFGRGKGDGSYNYPGNMDYIQIVIED